MDALLLPALRRWLIDLEHLYAVAEGRPGVT